MGKNRETTLKTVNPPQTALKSSPHSFLHRYSFNCKENMTEQACDVTLPQEIGRISPGMGSVFYRLSNPTPCCGGHTKSCLAKKRQIKMLKQRCCDRHCSQGL